MIERRAQRGGEHGRSGGVRRAPGRARRRRTPVVTQRDVSPLVFDGHAVLDSYAAAIPRWLSGGGAGVGAAVRLVASLSRMSCCDGCTGLLWRGGPSPLAPERSTTARGCSDSPQLVVAVSCAPRTVVEAAVASPNTLFLAFLHPHDVTRREASQMAAVGNCTPCVRVGGHDDATRSTRACCALREAGAFFGLAILAPAGALAAPSMTGVLSSIRCGAYVGWALHNDELGGPHRLESIREPGWMEKRSAEDTGLDLP